MAWLGGDRQRELIAEVLTLIYAQQGWIVGVESIGEGDDECSDRVFGNRLIVGNVDAP